MSEPARKVVLLKQGTVPPDKMLVLMNAGELRELIAEVVEQKLNRLSTARPGGLLRAEQAAEFLGYSKDWVYRNWQRIGGQKIGGKGLRFDAVELQRWIESRRGS
jgi:predicted DNA-binding transcriptional regulator AlpA